MITVVKILISVTPPIAATAMKLEIYTDFLGGCLLSSFAVVVFHTFELVVVMLCVESVVVAG